MVEITKTPDDLLLTINEWLDAIGCDRAYRKDMKETYKKAIPELKAQLEKVLALLPDEQTAFDKGVKHGTTIRNLDWNSENHRRHGKKMTKAKEEAKREERERIIVQLEKWRDSGTHLISFQAIQALKDK